MFDYYDLTDNFPIKFDLEKMREELKLLEDKTWLSHYDVNLADGWTTIPLVTHDGSSTNEDSQRVGKWGRYKNTEYVEQLPYFKYILDTFKCPHGRIRIMNLQPNSIIREHRDTYDEVSDYAFNQVRLHIPIITNDKVIFRVDGKDYHLKEGRLYYINFSKKHYVNNNGDTPRIHLVLDLKVNDFLRSIFPRLTILQKVECILSRIFLPIFIWFPSILAVKTNTYFWKFYEGSSLQRFRHKYFSKNPV